jgi:hypothetical protein
VQIPSDWLKVNQHIRNYIVKPEGNFEDAGLDEISMRFEKVYSSFIVSIKLNKETNQVKEANSFSQNDKFFLNGNSGIELFNILIDLKKWAELLPENDESKKLFYELFSEDLENGIKNEEAQKWLKWRWQHIPASLSLNLMEELKLRLKLLSQFEKNLDSNRAKNSFSIRNNQSKMRIGDRSELLLSGDSIEFVEIKINNKAYYDFKFSGDTLIFNPQYAGLYEINIKGKNSSEKLQIDVKPRPFGDKDRDVLKVGYKGVQYKEYIFNLNKSMRLEHDEACLAYLNSAKSKLIYTPKRSGWIRFKIYNEGGLYCQDSVFVKSLPNPIISVKDLATNTISKKRFIRDGELELIAMHPSFNETTFQIKSFKVNWVGNGSKTEQVNGSKINVNADEFQKMQYLIIHSIEIKSGEDLIKREQPIIIQII